MKRCILTLFILIQWIPLLGAADLDFREAGKIVIQSGGRKKPLDTFAAETFQTLSGRRSFRDPETDRGVAAMDALFSM